MLKGEIRSVKGRDPQFEEERSAVLKGEIRSMWERSAVYRERSAVDDK